MAYYPPDVIQKAKQMDLLTYLRNYDPEELVHFSRDTYTTRTHDSLKISNGMWYWFSQSIGGKSALEYLIKVKDYSFLQAVETIVGNVITTPPKIYKTNKKTIPDRLYLPDKAPNNDKAKAYLISRGIDEDIIQECIDKDLIYQQNKSNNVVFIGYDKNNKARYAMCRGTNESRYMNEVTGSHKAFSFKLESIEESDTLHLFESAIDLLSYATLLKLNDKEWYNTHLLSLAGVYKAPPRIEDVKVPLALNYYLNQHQNIKKIYLHLDNDYTGRSMTSALKAVLQNQYEVIDSPVPSGKDVNDFLCEKLGIKNKKINERER